MEWWIARISYIANIIKKKENRIFLFYFIKKSFLGLFLVSWKGYRIKFSIFTFKKMTEKIVFLIVELCLSTFVWVFMSVFMCACVHFVLVEARDWEWVSSSVAFHSVSTSSLLPIHPAFYMNIVGPNSGLFLAHWAISSISPPQYGLLASGQRCYYQSDGWLSQPGPRSFS